MDIRKALNLINESTELTESTGLECEFVETAPGVWYYLLENDFNSNDWDWREDCRCFGPFRSEEQAHEHLRENHANPGGSSSIPFSGEEPSDLMKKLMAEAPSYMKYTRNPFESFRRWAKPI